MSNEINFILTNSAAELIPKVLNGKTLNFTRMAVGDGFSYNTEIAKGYKTIVNEVLSLDITKKEILSPSSIKITSAFKNTDAQKEFYYREVGLYDEDPDTKQEVLYAYGNRNDAAELITPSGSSVTSKQLIFLVSVGDSANVTFNVNADVYALQSDMLDVQENKANKNLSNTGMITNCLLEVPQRIKYELTSGTLTIKAGSVIIVPHGTEAPTYSIGDKFWTGNFKVVDIQYNPNALKPKLFYWLELPEDITETIYQTDTTGTLLINSTGAAFMPYQEIYAADTTPTPVTDWCIWFDMTNNHIKYTNDKGTTWNTNGTSLPVLTFKTDKNGVYGEVTQVFNGLGYIGSIAWSDKGLKGLIPNGRNADGTLNNIEYTSPNLSIYGAGGRDYNDINFFINTEGLLGNSYLYESEEIISSINAKTYIPSKNIIYKTDGTTHKEFYIGKGTISDKRITSLKPYTTFKAVNKSSDKPWLSGLSMPSEKYDELTLGESGSSYTAPANGWFAIRKVAGIANANFTLAVWDSTGSDEICRTTMYAPTEITEIAFFVPVSKWQTVAVDYNATGKTEYFRFIYAQGEVN